MSTTPWQRESAVLFLDELGNVKGWNKFAAQIKGYTTAEVIGKHFTGFYTKSDQQDGLPERLLEEARTNGTATNRGWRVRKDGSLFQAHIAITALFNEENKVTGYTKFVYPIQEPATQAAALSAEANLPGQPNSSHLPANSATSMWTVDTQCALVASSETFDKLVQSATGKTPRPGEDILAYGIYGDKTPEYRAYLYRALAGESFRATVLSGFTIPRWIDLLFEPVVENGTVVGARCKANDVTASENADEKIRLYEASLRTIFEHATDLLVLADASGNLVSFNNNAADSAIFTQVSRMQVGQPVLSYVWPERKEFVRKMFDDIIRQQSSFNYETHLTDPTGLEYWYELHLNPIKDHNQVLGICLTGHDITAQVTALDKIRDEQKRFRALAENSSDAVVIFNEKFEPVYASRSVFNVTGFTEEEYMNMSMSELVCPDDADKVRAKFGRALDNPGKAITDIPIRLVHKDGTWHWYEGTARNLLSDPGISGIVVNFRDVTEKVSLALNLDAEKKRYAHLFDQAPSSICILEGPDFVYQMVNPSYVRLTGKTDLIGKKAADVFPELVQQGFLGLLTEVYQSGKPFVGNEILMKLDMKGTGVLEDHYFNFIYQPYSVSGGSSDGIFFFANEVTGQVVGRRKTEEKEKHFRALVENSGDIIIVVDAEMKLQYMTPALEKITGYPAQEILSQPLSLLIHPDFREDTDTNFRKVLANPGCLLERTNCFQHKNGSVIWVEGVIRNLLDDPTVNGVVTNLHNITERKQAEDKLARANRLYAFISGINHTIIHTTNQEDLFRQVCLIATEVGKFKIAWIGLLNQDLTTINLQESNGLPEEEQNNFKNLRFDPGSPPDHVLKTHSYYLCNDLAKDFQLRRWDDFIVSHSLRSIICLPIRKSGMIIGTLNLYSSEVNLFDTEEIVLLEDIAREISFALDVFEKEKLRRAMQEKVVHSELLLNQAQAAAHLGSWEYNLASGTLYCSEEACRIYGLEPNENEQTFESWLACIHPDDVQMVNHAVREGIKTGNGTGIRHRIIQKNGDVRYTFTQFYVVHDTAGRPIALNGIDLDITETKMAEDALARSEAYLRLIMDLIPQAIYAKDSNGRYVFMNKRFAELYGVAPKDMIGLTAYETDFDKDEVELSLKEDREVMLTGRSKTIYEHTFTNNKGIRRLFRTIKVPFAGTGKDESAVLCITHDITEQKIAEKERSKIIADIIQRNKDLEQFSFIVSHNLRAPVANIMGLTTILESFGFESPDEREMIDGLTSSVKKLDDVIMDLNYILQIKHTENRQKEIVSFTHLLKDIKQSIDNLIRADDVRIYSDFAQVDEILTFRTYLYSIFFNLISNSIKYRQPNLSPVIHISSSIANNTIRLVFSDNGLGINLEKNNSYMFGLYKRFHGHKEGKGMGLYMVKTQVESLGGRISVSSKVNEGTVFTIDFELTDN